MCVFLVFPFEVPDRPVGSFMGRQDLKEYAEKLVTFVKKDFSDERNRTHFTFTAHKTSHSSVY